MNVVEVLPRKDLGNLSLTWEDLETVLGKIESAVNKRPIKFLYERSCNGVPVPLCPEMFLFDASGGTVLESPSQITDLLCAKIDWGRKMESLWRSEYLLGVLGEAKRIWRRIRTVIRPSGAVKWFWLGMS